MLHMQTLEQMDEANKCCICDRPYEDGKIFTICHQHIMTFQAHSEEIFDELQSDEFFKYYKHEAHNACFECTRKRDYFADKGQCKACVRAVDEYVDSFTISEERRCKLRQALEVKIGDAISSPSQNATCKTFLDIHQQAKDNLHIYDDKIRSDELAYRENLRKDAVFRSNEKKAADEELQNKLRELQEKNEREMEELKKAQEEAKQAAEEEIKKAQEEMRKVREEAMQSAPNHVSEKATRGRPFQKGQKVTNVLTPAKIAEAQRKRVGTLNEKKRKISDYDNMKKEIEDLEIEKKTLLAKIEGAKNNGAQVLASIEGQAEQLNEFRHEIRRQLHLLDNE